MSENAKIKHLQMLQDVIKRMGETCAATKRYALVVFAAMAALARVQEMPFVFLIAAVVVVVFWALDAQYLRQEKWFRDFYDVVRKKDKGDIDFDMTPPEDIRNKTGIGYGFGNWSTRWLYGALFVITILLWLSSCNIATEGSA
ncbi:MAG: hypothetical protein IIA72_14595 [Proteobacteria bacterium]|nr:hypothetical protein [Pseudomonadota bacterium]